jgi:hypothetical protein
MNRLPRKLVLAALLAPALALIGCTSSGLSPREIKGRDISSFTTASFRLDHAAQRINAGRPAVSKPISVVAVQLGEVAPPQELMERLRDESELFSSVQPSTGVVSSVRPHGHHARQAGHVYASDSTREHAQMLMQSARDMGADTLLIYGGTVDATDRGTPLSLLDITIVGAFVLPSRVIETEGKAMAMLVDTETGQVIATTSADAADTSLSTSFGKQGAQRNQMQSVRDDVIDELTVELIERVRKL